MFRSRITCSDFNRQTGNATYAYLGGTGGAPPHNHTGHTWHHPDAQLREWILNGKLGFGNPGMPALKDRVAEPELDAILTFVKTWWTAEQRASQADISQRKIVSTYGRIRVRSRTNSWSH